MYNFLIATIFGHLPQERSWLPKAQSIVEEDDSGAVDEQEVVDQYTQKKFVPFTVLWKLNLIVMTIFFTFGITLIFPVFASVVESVHTDSQSRFLNKNIYIPFIYLVWNLGDLLGRVLCGYQD